MRNRCVCLPLVCWYTTPPPPPSLQCLSLLRVLVCNPESHQILVEAKVIPAIIKQVGPEGWGARSMGIAKVIPAIIKQVGRGGID